VICAFADAPLMRTLIPFVVRVPKLKESNGADSFGTAASFAIDVPASVTVATVIVAPVPVPPVVA